MTHRTIAAGCALLILLLINISCTQREETRVMKIGLPESVRLQAVSEMTEKFGEEHRGRIEIGVRQVAERWRSDDGTPETFRSFCLENFKLPGNDLDLLFDRFQANLEALYGNLHRINRQFMWQLHVDGGTVLPVDYMFGGFDVYAHVEEDLFASKIAFTALLNFPIASLEMKTAEGTGWSRRAWAEARLADEFLNRVPAEVNQKRTGIYTVADDYISNYNIYMHRLVRDDGTRLFPEDLRLISHWGLRDELKALYANPDGLERQRTIYKVMERIIAQDIPEIMVNRNEADWNPFTNEVRNPDTGDKQSASPEPNTRYHHLWNIFRSELTLDPYMPATPSLIDRRFNRQREILESDVEAVLHEVMTAPALKKIAALIQRRLGRELEPFDIWYDGFKARGNYGEEQLDRIVKERFPTVKAFEERLPVILRNLGFTREKAAYLAERIQVDPSRGAGHAWGARMRDDKTHLRTRVPAGGMDYKGFNIAMHELGHNVEQIFSLEGVDYYTMNGVPNTAFTEAFAFVFQYRDLDMLGLSSDDPQAAAMRSLNDMWMTFEIAGVSLTDIRIWRWMYANPDAGPEKTRDAVMEIARGVWNEYFAPVFGVENSTVLAIYSHIIDLGMYTPDYAIGHIIAFQIEDYLKGKNLAVEMERMCRLGRIAPQVWMQQAVGSPISAQPMIGAAEAAVSAVR